MKHYRLEIKDFVDNLDLEHDSILVFEGHHDFFEHESIINKLPFPPYLIVEEDKDMWGNPSYIIQDNIIEEEALAAEVVMPVLDLKEAITFFLEEYEDYHKKNNLL